MNKLLKKLELLEEKLSILLGKLVQWFIEIILKIIPAPVLKVLTQVKLKCIEYKAKLVAWTKSFLILSFNKTKNFLLSLFAAVKRLLNFPIQERINKFLGSIKENLVPSSLIKVYDHFKKLLSPYIQKVRAKFHRLASSQVFIASMAIGLAGAGLIGIYVSSRNIYHQEFPDREPASEQVYDYKPDYLKFDKKTVKVQNIRVPLLVEREGKISSVTIDFSVRTSTKFAKIYLENYEYKLKDYFYTSVEPITSDFVLTPEGKSILLEKIKIEINNFLKQEKVEGEVDEVTVQFIIGS